MGWNILLSVADCGCPVMIYCYKINPTRPGGRALVGVRAPLVDKVGPWRDQAKLSCGGPAVALDQGHDDCGKQPEAERLPAAGAAQGDERGNRHRNRGQVGLGETGRRSVVRGKRGEVLGERGGRREK